MAPVITLAELTVVYPILDDSRCMSPIMTHMIKSDFVVLLVHSIVKPAFFKAEILKRIFQMVYRRSLCHWRPPVPRNIRMVDPTVIHSHCKSYAVIFVGERTQQLEIHIMLESVTKDVGACQAFPSAISVIIHVLQTSSSETYPLYVI